MPADKSSPSIRWRQWGEPAFRDAAAQGKPVLLALTATWCHWCHVMDRTSYSHPQVIGLVNSRFIPVRVDADQRPDISLRYNQGGLPSVAFLDSAGATIAGRVYTPADEMVRLLAQVSTEYSPGSSEAVGRTSPPAAPAVVRRASNNRKSPAQRVLDRLRELYDPDFGGFGREPKQPPWEALGLLLARYSRDGERDLLAMATATLQGMRGGLYDQRDLGFFRYSVARDWKVPHYEKMLSSNASLALAYLEAYQLTGKRLYRAVASGALEYLLGTLYDRRSGLFHASQDAGEDFYRLPWQDRAKAAQPAVDRTFYTGWNALAALALIKASAVLAGDRYLSTATRTLAQIGAFNRPWHQGLPHSVKETGQEPHYLADHVHAFRALLELYQVTGDADVLWQAEQAPEAAEKLFGAPAGGFYDVAVARPARDRPVNREIPVLENSLLAEGLARLSCLTGNTQYQMTARNTLALFQEVAPGSSYLGPPGSRRMEEDEERLFLPAASAWARAWDTLEHGPVHLVLVGRPSDLNTRRLRRAALRIYAPHKVVQLLDPQRHRELIAAKSLPAGEKPGLYVCLGNRCLAPITTPEEVRLLASAPPWSGQALESRTES